MKKFLFLPLLLAATTLFAEVRVETFDVKDGTTTNTYVTSATTKECQQASWTVFAGGVLKNLGNMGSTNYASVTRAMKDADNGVYPYMESSTIQDGIDSLWFTWNSNGAESGQWNVVIYINGDSVGSLTGAAGAMIEAGQPMNTFCLGNLNIAGDFTIKIVNKSLHSGAQNKNSKRLVIDDLSWTTHGSAPVKAMPTFSFADEALIKKIDVIAFTNTLTNTSDATPTFESSNTAVATVAANGTVTIVGEGTTTITASVAETDNFKAATASYTLRVVPLNFNIETFDGAANATGNATYFTNDSVAPISDAGVIWTTHLGSIRDNLGQSGTANIAAVIRAKKTSEANYGFLESNAIAGGIASLAFDWNANGTEASRQHPWDIRIYINGDSVGAIHDAGAAVQQIGHWFRYTLENINVAGDFTIKIVNMNDADDGTSNHYRFVIDNLEWLSYETPAPAHVYSVAGSEALMGTNWNETTGNEMTLQQDGTYKLVIENVTLAASTYEYKVVIDHQWNNGEAAQNSQLLIEQAGIYDVTFTYDPAVPTTAAQATLKEAIIVLPTVQLAGSFNSWTGEDFTAAEDKLTASISKTLAAGTHEFKIIIASNWKSNSKQFTRDDNTATGITGNDNTNMTIVADREGIYTFTWTFANDALEITYPVASGLDNTEVRTVTKQLVNGQLVITIDGIRYDAQGQIIR